MIAGAEGGIEINAHIDACLSKDIINEFSQQSFNPGIQYPFQETYRCLVELLFLLNIDILNLL